ncbi:hypothetical protein TeGR_g7365 [Tetraparma gracilis]|jgi:hypothetical protein|uniref:Uncharacterized protein n=1 Tax=Tetraparma gracilis TaxID=2962635 RepID=A0ABQ6MTE2_9STRA|nr:hypothetical protein TeGR_g7365 [Tetraparma gracilis]
MEFGKDLNTISSPSARVAEIQKQLAYLQWRRVQVEGSIRAIVDSEKVFAERDALLSLSQDAVKEKQLWTQEIVADELCKPLELSKQFVSDFEEDEDRFVQQAQSNSKKHMQSLKALKQKIEKSPTSPTSERLMSQIAGLENHIVASGHR